MRAATRQGRCNPAKGELQETVIRDFVRRLRAIDRVPTCAKYYFPLCFFSKHCQAPASSPPPNE